MMQDMHDALLDVQVMAELQLDDWAIGESEIQIMQRADGSLWELGHGAFGQVQLAFDFIILDDPAAIEERAAAIRGYRKAPSRAGKKAAEVDA